ncbi:hypothetical protein PSEUBRA_000694 [Kalmanozyma brasiliensis GHG001]|uniref:uncharacterized protein n=1 Tax=Kalmanozyma brasiliensis (strain GHG001) TaxID=1365824 RepID=UPI002867E8BB|nr:uncharacterized protein PSEUBRA_000694 [Kalmanozyma brasiliensis GHG001]KAF6766835.1 hypothetical protein PSEUBRA_000694 [Kalmanozyma brasiliensis GHG001]
MLASTSTASASLLSASTSTAEGLKHLYRTILRQARLLSCTFDDPILFSSHRYLARKNLEPLLTPSTSEPASSQEWPPSTAVKRLLRAKAHRRHLADANFGWEHSVQRSLSLAYARTGKLRRDVLGDLSPTPSSAAKEQKYEKRLRRKDFSPVLQTLLTSPSSMDGAAVKSKEHLMRRPPPPFLPAEDDALVKLFGKAISRRRVANASKKFVKTYLRKVLVPLDVVSFTAAEGGTDGSIVAHLEAKARGKPSRGSRKRDNAQWLSGARQKVDHYRSDMDSSEHRKRALRQHGWSSHPKDYSRPRAQRRLYGRLLADVPLLLIDTHTMGNASEGSGERKNDPLGMRMKLGSISHQGEGGAGKIKVVKSRYAVGPKARNSGSGGGELIPRGLFDPAEKQRTAQDWLDDSEVAFLKQQGLL